MGEDRGDTARGDQVAGSHAAAEQGREVPEVDHVDAAQAVRRVLEPAPALGVGPRADRAAGVADPAVAERVQVRHGLADAVRVVDDDGRQAAVQPVDEQQGDVVVEHVPTEPVELDVGHPRGAEDDAVHLGAEVPDQLALQARVLLGVRDEQCEPESAGTRLDALGDGGEERVLQVRHHEAEVPGAARDELPRGPVGPVAEVAGDLLDVLPAGGGDEIGSAERAGGRRRRDARGSRDIAQRDHHSPSLPRPLDE